MFKRIIVSILSIVMAGTLLCGCSFFEHNSDRDNRQVVAVIESYDIEKNVKEPVEDEDGNVVSERTVTKTYTTTAHTVYKYDLIQYINNNYSSLSQSYSDNESLVKHALEMLVDTEIIINDVDALIAVGLIDWNQKEKNAVKKRIYTSIDSSIITIQNEILTERDKPGIDTSGSDSASSDTTYPVKPQEDVDDKDDISDEEPWEPERSRYPGLTGDSDMRSLGREAMRRFITLLKDRVKDDFRVTDEDKEEFKKDDEDIQDIIDKQGIEYVYPILGDTHYIKYLIGKNIERSNKINALQEYLTESVSVSSQEVAESYTATLNQQRSAYASIKTFEAAMSGSSTVLYYPNNDYFYVKHILLPFTDEQVADLNAYKSKLNVSDEQVKAYRDKLAEKIVAYPHVAGENDMRRPMTVSQVMDEIRAVMLPLESNVRDADRAFDDLVYLYNTDPGMFGNSKGYVVKDSDTGNNWVAEFTEAARYMRGNLSVGQVYYKPIVTDYGVHIMYLASVTKVGAVGLYDNTTPGEHETYYDLLEKPISSSRESAAYSSWEADVINYNYGKHVTMYEDRYKDLWN